MIVSNYPAVACCESCAVVHGMDFEKLSAFLPSGEGICGCCDKVAQVILTNYYAMESCQKRITPKEKWWEYGF